MSVLAKFVRLAAVALLLTLFGFTTMTGYGQSVDIVAISTASPYGYASEQVCNRGDQDEVRELGLIYVHALNAANLDQWYALLAEDYTGYYSNVAFQPMDRVAGRADAEGLLSAFPGLQTEVNMSIVSADCRFVTYYWTSRVNVDMPADDTGSEEMEIAVSGVNIAEIEDGKIVAEWTVYDQTTVLSQLGLMGEANAETG